MVDFLLACGVDVATSLRSFAWMTFDFGDVGLLTGCCFLLCDSDGDSDSDAFCTPSDVLPCFTVN